MKHVITLAICICACVTLNAQHELDGYENKESFLRWMIQDEKLLESMQPRHPMPMLVNSFPSYKLDTAIDVLWYRVTIDWYRPLLTRKDFRGPRKAECNVVMGIQGRDSMANVVVLDAVNLTIDSVFVSQVDMNTPETPVKFTHANGKLTVTVNAPLWRGNNVYMRIHYAVQRDDDAMNVWNKEDAAVNAIPGGSAFTFSQPEGARRFFPCNDVPHDKATFTTVVRVPKGYAAVSNGFEQGVVPDGDTAEKHIWAEGGLMPTYLFTVNAGEFINYKQTYTRKDGSTVPIANYHFAQDQNDSVYNATNALKNAQLWFESLEEKLGRYPFRTYGHVTVSPLPFGGMEHQTMSTINRYWLRGTAELGYVHELGHQWLGDLVTCATWADIWLNEGGASFTEALYGEYVKGPTSYAKVLRNKRDRYMRRGQAEPPVYDIPLANLFNEATTYNKSSWIYHMMRRMLGDSVFFPVLRSYIDKYKYDAAQTFQFKQHFVENVPNPPLSWDVFFDQWLIKQGHPEFAAVINMPESPQGATVPVRITVAQIQKAANVPVNFHVPLTLRVKWGSTWYDTTIVMTTPSIDVTYQFPNDGSTLSFPDPAAAASLIDPDESILCTRFAEVITGVDDESRASDIRLIGPTPARDHITLDIHEGSPLQASWLTADGKTVHEFVLESGLQVLDVSTLPAGVFFLHLERVGATTVFSVPVIH
ncbi:MAG: M1 family metallopeptidase [Ignavibacteria bacterium]|nr:M1 family metallopeptidase [Ignavibacteria bacterium]